MTILALATGVVIGGAIMYYIQPTIKTAVAKAFGYEPQLIAEYNTLIAKLKAAQAAK